VPRLRTVKTSDLPQETPRGATHRRATARMPHRTYSGSSLWHTLRESFRALRRPLSQARPLGFECTLVHILDPGDTGFEWDEIKARTNLRKHGVAFADATVVFEDEHALTIKD
jgi:hypothetical protein